MPSQRRLAVFRRRSTGRAPTSRRFVFGGLVTREPAQDGHAWARPSPAEIELTSTWGRAAVPPSQSFRRRDFFIMRFGPPVSICSLPGPPRVAWWSSCGICMRIQARRLLGSAGQIIAAASPGRPRTELPFDAWVAPRLSRAPACIVAAVPRVSAAAVMRRRPVFPGNPSASARDGRCPAESMVTAREVAKPGRTAPLLDVFTVIYGHKRILFQ